MIESLFGLADFSDRLILSIIGPPIGILFALIIALALLGFVTRKYTSPTWQTFQKQSWFALFILLTVWFAVAGKLVSEHPNRKEAIAWPIWPDRGVVATLPELSDLTAQYVTSSGTPELIRLEETVDIQAMRVGDVNIILHCFQGEKHWARLLGAPNLYVNLRGNLIGGQLSRIEVQGAVEEHGSAINRSMVQVDDYLALSIALSHPTVRAFAQQHSVKQGTLALANQDYLPVWTFRLDAEKKGALELVIDAETGVANIAKKKLRFASL